MGDDWLLEATLPHPDGDTSRDFGFSVAVDQGRIFVTLSESTSTSAPPTILVYENGPNGSETSRVDLPPPFPSAVAFGETFAVDGNILAVSFYNSFIPDVYIYEFDGIDWVFRFQYFDIFFSHPILSGNPGTLPPLAISGDRVLIGTAAGATTSQGYVYVVGRTNGVFEFETLFSHPQPGFLDGFGAAVALDGDVAMVGSPGTGLSGEVLFFERDSSGLWNPLVTLSDPGASPGAGFGARVALDGKRGVAGAPFDSRVATTAGSAMLF